VRNSDPIRSIGTWLQAAGLAVVAFGACVLSTASSSAAERGIVRLDVYPTEIELSSSADRQQFVVVATRADGVTLDVTEVAEITLSETVRARLEGHTLRPALDGDTMMTVRYADHTVDVPVTVHDARTERSVSFKLDVMPVFMRSGCNTGSCHGAARGKDGFMLSLFGYDPDGDHQRITREIGFRRVNLAIPSASLLLEKAVGAVPHTGGSRFSTDSEYYATMLRWLEDGAPKDSDDVPTVEGIELYPRQAVLQGAGATQQFVVRARYSDGTDRDVTNLAVFISNNDNSATVTEDGLVTAAVRGEAFIMARFETYTVGRQVIVLPGELAYSPPEETPANYVDELVNSKLNKLRILPSAICTDAEFIRRATLDVAGLLPTDQETTEFVADTDPDKRAKLIDRLLERPEFAEIWAMKWSEMLAIRSSNQVSAKSMFRYSTWLNEQIAENVPVDEMTKALLASSGGTFTDPATNYYLVERDTLKTAENTAQIFMGLRIQCAQCHNHPFDQWTMNDYYSFAAFFGQVGRKLGEDYRETIVYDRKSGEVRHPVTRKNMPPKFLGAAAPDVKGRDRREVLADWLASPENPYFATSIANRVWEHFFGVGIVNPVDDVRVSNPPSNPELYDMLGQKLTDYGYDFKQLVRDLCNSKAYQRSTVRNASNERDELNFAHATVRRIRAESLLDCISQVTESPEKYRGLPLGSRAVEVTDGANTNYFLTTFGRAPRTTVCTCEVRTEPTLSQALHLINGTTVESKVRSGGVVKQLLEQKLSPPEVIDTLYRRCLSRPPSEEERVELITVVEAAPDVRQGLEDVFWALLNSREFIFNH